jgi:hypothetical protein
MMTITGWGRKKFSIETQPWISVYPFMAMQNLYFTTLQYIHEKPEMHEMPD